jgi:peptide deformylase
MKKPFDDTTIIHDVVIYGNPVLRKRAAEITVFDDDLRKFASEMFATMEDYDGIGLAAPQVDRLIRLLVIGLPEEDSDDMFYLAVANPEIVEKSTELWDMEEGCLSIPDVRDDVTRPEAITVEYTTLNGERKTIKATGMLARVLQHEIDHLNGILFIDHLSPVRRALLNGKLKRLERDQQES